MFTFFNDTGRIINIHAATLSSLNVDDSPIQPLEERTFHIPRNSLPWVKMWDHRDRGLTILVLDDPIKKEEYRNEKNS